MGFLSNVPFIGQGLQGAEQAFNQFFGQGGSGANGWTPWGSIPVGGTLVQGPPGYGMPPPNPAEAPGQGPSAYNNYNPFANGPGLVGAHKAPLRPPTIHTSPMPTPPSAPPPVTTLNSPVQGMWRGGMGTGGPFGQQWDIQFGNGPWQKASSGTPWANPWTTGVTPVKYPGAQ